MRIKTILAGFLGVALTTLPAASQSSREQEEAERKAEAAKLAADPALSLAANAAFLANNLRLSGVLHRPSGLQYKIIQNGYGRHPGGADTVEVYYTGKLINGKVFDGTSPGLPATFQVGKVVAGWTEALQLMREGDHWMLWIPANLAYGPRGTPDGSVPPNQTLIFDLRLLATKGPPKKGDPDYRPEPGEQDDQK
ncbi:MAG: FKBP-type peptidyl-prolyl cis-trans isomerase [Alphaproteobacteria bacterium]|nr:FKBP-type peptidyl-prolyl cis-trans isomerase [Alphaproteobacteria bacterium]